MCLFNYGKRLTMHTYKIKIVEVSRIEPHPKFMELNFELGIYDSLGEKLKHNYTTTLALLYSDELLQSDKTTFYRINSDTGKPIEDNFECITVNKSDCMVFPPVTYENFDIESWQGICGELTTNKSFS